MSFKETEFNKNQMKGGEKMMKIIFRLLMVALLSLVLASSASAVIKDSKHDFSSDSGSSYSVTEGAGESRMCVFCHTPHNAVENVPLWNRTSAMTGYKLYTSSATLSTEANTNAGMDSTHISYKCLTCHDGTVSIGGGAVQFQSAAMSSDNTTLSGDARIDDTDAGGKGLTDDHPIGFDYSKAATLDNNDGYPAFNATADVKTNLRLFNAGTGNKDQIECASCHDVHGQAGGSSPSFLRTNNIGSNLCLTCHIK